MDRLNVTTLCSQEATKLVQPVLLGYLLRYLETYETNDYHGLELAYYYALGMSLCSLLLAVIQNSYFHYQMIGMKIRVALCHMIYKKVSLLEGAGGSGCCLKRGVFYLQLLRNSQSELKL